VNAHNVILRRFLCVISSMVLKSDTITWGSTVSNFIHVQWEFSFLLSRYVIETIMVADS
jgi:hypothetical protein